jgi:hypothetical protein
MPGNLSNARASSHSGSCRHPVSGGWLPCENQSVPSRLPELGWQLGSDYAPQCDLDRGGRSCLHSKNSSNSSTKAGVRSSSEERFCVLSLLGRRERTSRSEREWSRRAEGDAFRLALNALQP